MYTVIAPFVMPRACAHVIASFGALHYNKPMPAYDYQCPSCGERKTVYRHYYLGDVIEPVCDKCGVEMERVYQAPAVHYKGSGYYVTDKKAAHVLKTP